MKLNEEINKKLKLYLKYKNITNIDNILNGYSKIELNKYLKDVMKHKDPEKIIMLASAPIGLKDDIAMKEMRRSRLCSDLYGDIVNNEGFIENLEYHRRNKLYSASIYVACRKLELLEIIMVFKGLGIRNSSLITIHPKWIKRLEER